MMRSFAFRLMQRSTPRLIAVLTLCGGAVACYGTPRTSFGDEDAGDASGAGGPGFDRGDGAGTAGIAGAAGMGVGGMSGHGGAGGGGGTACSTSADCDAADFCSAGRCISDVVTVAAGYWHTCALRKDGKLFCWGGNDTAQVGMPAGGNMPLPVEVPIGQPIAKVALGGAFSCVLTTQGKVSCWGDDQFGELGDGTAGGNRPTPSFVKMEDGSDLSSVVDVAAGPASRARSRRSAALVSTAGAATIGRN
jgi:hypothetical protein